MALRRAGQPTHYSCLENPMDRGAWGATVHRLRKSWTQLKRLKKVINDKVVYLCYLA